MTPRVNPNLLLQLQNLHAVEQARRALWLGLLSVICALIFPLEVLVQVKVSLSFVKVDVL